jgi:hypothetical protein
MEGMMTDNTIVDKLLKWAELDPEWCKNDPFPSWDNQEDKNIYVSTQYPGKEYYGWHLVYSETNPSDDENFYPFKSDALMHIQWSVQNAIAARGWDYELLYDSYLVRLGGVGHWADVNNLTEREAGDSPTEALLSAYLKAIEQ